MVTLESIDLVLKILLAIVSLGGIVFVAGSWWATIKKLDGSVTALHRRMSEDQTERKHREEVVDSLFMQLRLDVRAIQAWKQTLRFRPVPPAQAEQDMFVVPEGQE